MTDIGNIFKQQLFGACIDGRVVNVANGALGNANTSYTYFNLAADGFRSFSVFATIQATTLTLEASNDNPDTADADATWTDVTTKLTGASNLTATGAWVLTTPIAVKRLRIKRLTTNATNALKIDLTRAK